MKNTILSIGLALSLTLLFVSCDDKKAESTFQNGDIIFMRLDIGQVKAIEKLSKTKYTHLGVIFTKKDSVFVYEAGGTVNLETLDRWIGRRSVDSLIVIKRLKEEYKTENFGKNLIHEGHKYKSALSDIVFNWSDSLIYASELVWKMYDRGIGVKLCPTKKMKDWDYTNRFAVDRLKAMYKIENPFVLEDTVVSPDDIFNSDKLETVFSGRRETLPKK